MHQVFISYAAADSEIAKQVLAVLESSHIQCWYAPRDISPSVSYQQSLMSAIENSRLLLLVLSSEALRSAHVKRDVWKAVAAGIAIYPFIIDETGLEQLLEHYWGFCPAFDASARPLEAHFAGITAAVQDIISAPSETATGARSAMPESEPSGSRLAAQRHLPEEWTGERRLNAISRVLYPEAVDADTDLADYVSFGDGFEERIVRMTLGGYRKIIIYGPSGCGKSSLLNMLTREIKRRGRPAFMWNPHTEVEEGECYCLSYQVLERLLEDGLVGNEMRPLLRNGLKEGGLWYSGVRKATRFLDRTLNRMRRASPEHTAVIILDNLDANDNNCGVSEVFSEFLDFKSGVFVGAIASTEEQTGWLDHYQVNRLAIPGLTVERLHQILARRLNALPFEHSDLVATDREFCARLIELFGSNQNRMFSACRDAILLYDRLDLDSLSRVT